MKTKNLLIALLCAVVFGLLAFFFGGSENTMKKFLAFLGMFLCCLVFAISLAKYFAYGE